MTRNSKCKTQNAELSSTAVLWDESFLWGLMAYKALSAGNLSFDLIRSEDIRAGRLKEYSLLFVPGGWASNKLKALGDEGLREIRKFVDEGGSYLGFCGGAGLATTDGIGLVPVKRRPTNDRVPSFSGRIRLDTGGHPAWQGITDPVFHAWWPSQFHVQDNGLKVLASYGQALPDAFSSDINVGDADSDDRWTELESLYRINLDPKRLMGEPAVIEGSFGQGKVVLSLIHFDTPGDRDGAIVLKNLWTCLGGSERPAKELSQIDAAEKAALSPALEDCLGSVGSLIELGTRNFLWFRRNSMLLQWRRGVRGLEYCTLYTLIGAIAESIREGKPAPASLPDDVRRIRQLLLPFVEKAKALLLRERFAMQNGHITYEKCDEPAIQAIREELFSRSKSYGGSFKTLIDSIDRLLYPILASPLKSDRVA